MFGNHITANLSHGTAASANELPLAFVFYFTYTNCTVGLDELEYS